MEFHGVFFGQASNNDVAWNWFPTSCNSRVPASDRVNARRSKDTMVSSPSLKALPSTLGMIERYCTSSYCCKLHRLIYSDDGTQKMASNGRNAMKPSWFLYLNSHVTYHFNLTFLCWKWVHPCCNIPLIKFPGWLWRGGDLRSLVWQKVDLFGWKKSSVQKKYQAYHHMGVSLNGGIPKSSILIGFSIMNHPFWGTPIFGNPHTAGTKQKHVVSLNINMYHYHICVKKLSVSEKSS